MFRDSILFSLILLCSCATAHADDRSGIVLGLSISSSHLSQNQFPVFGLERMEGTLSEAGDVVSWRIGGSLNGRSCWYLLNQTNVDSGYSVFSLSGLGANWYLHQHRNHALYVHGGLGLGRVRDHASSSTRMGQGVMLGAGLQWRSGWRADFNLSQVVGGGGSDSDELAHWRDSASQLLLGYTWR